MREHDSVGVCIDSGLHRCTDDALYLGPVNEPSLNKGNPFGDIRGLAPSTPSANRDTTDSKTAWNVAAVAVARDGTGAGASRCRFHGGFHPNHGEVGVTSPIDLRRQPTLCCMRSPDSRRLCR